MLYLCFALTLATVAKAAFGTMIRLHTAATTADKFKIRMAVVTVAVVILIANVCAACFARIGSIIAGVAHAVFAALVGKICAAYAALGAILILAAIAQELKAIPIPVGSATGLAQANKSIPAALARATDQWVRISVSHAAIIALGKIALIFVIIHLMAAALAIPTPNVLRSKISAAQRTRHQRRIGPPVTIHT